MYDRHRRSFVIMDRHLFNLVKSSVASRHFFISKQEKFTEKLTEYVKKVPLSDELEAMRVTTEDIQEFMPLVMSEYWE